MIKFFDYVSRYRRAVLGPLQILTDNTPPHPLPHITSINHLFYNIRFSNTSAFPDNDVELSRNVARYHLFGINTISF